MEELIAIVAIVAVFAVPVIAVLTKHQQKMTELIHRNQTPPIPVRDNLRSEIAELKDLVAQQAIALDNLRQSTESLHAKINNQAELQERVRE